MDRVFRRLLPGLCAPSSGCAVSGPAASSAGAVDSVTTCSRGERTASGAFGSDTAHCSVMELMELMEVTGFITQTSDLVKSKEKIQAVSCGDDTVTLLSERGSVLYVDVHTYTPQLLKVFCNKPVTHVSCGSRHSVALTKDGQVYTWGQNSRGQLGLETSGLDVKTPQHVRSVSAVPVVHIAAGGEQSFAVSFSGCVFAWGWNDCGQLGLGDRTDRRTPTSVLCLNAKKSVHVSCGENHTAVLTKDGVVFTFGSGQHGQLGHNSFRDELRPRLVAELWGAKVIKIACGRYGGSTPLGVMSKGSWDVERIAIRLCRFLFSCHKNDESNDDSVNNITQHSTDDMIDKWTSRCDSKSWKKIKLEIRRTFSSASSANKCFLDQRHFQTSPKYPGLNLKLARAAFKKLAKRDDVWAEVEAALLELLPSLDEKLVGVETLRIFLLLNELLHVIQRNKQRQSTELAVMVAAAIRRLSEESLHVIGDWWCSLSPSTMVKHVKTWKQVLSEILSSETGHCNLRVQNLLVVLQYMYNFVMDLKSKKTAFDIYVDRTMSKHQVVKPWPYEFVSSDRFFELRLKRTSLLEGAFTQLAAARHSDFKKPFVVYLDEDPAVTDVYKRDFFHHLFPELVSPESGMFMFNDSVTLPWFPSRATKEDETKFFLFGVLCGLALYNQCIVYLPFPLALFKKLLDVEPTLEDLKEFSGVGKTLQDVMGYEDDVLENLFMSFSINWDGADVILDPQNPQKPVTGENKKEFVDAYMNHILNTSIEGVFREFKRGFFEVCDQKQVKLFTPEELQGVMVGREIYDWAKLKRNTVYESYYASHPTIQMFWEVFDDLTEEQKKDFLLFLTGFRTVPILGMDQIKMKVRVAQIESSTHDQHRPKSLTCHSILYLPVYSNKEIMQDRLTEALIEDKAFRLNG
ncbi:putative E3 ubiquitin-protein ligase HERC6 [Collichthys lucidus]|uniref:Putative E3 ubiquitin-protein ligase HERC6 n=1 Tax=Collichthys lucidus TaxID=240159 RepID=A0A4U5UEE0_COLLU|nr:putative E3 ubiquitin-protein ligase HERC6 [Collichthys lucidus]